MKMSRLEINVDNSMLRRTTATSKGDQTKWENKGYWVKENAMGYEDIAEWATSMILTHCTMEPIPHVDYQLARIKREDGTIKDGCISRNFIPRGATLVTVYRLFEQFNVDFSVIESKGYSTDYKIKYTIENLYKITGLDTTDYLRKLITLDAFILNEDRHFNNIAFLHKDGVFDYAPIFDNGLSLLSDTGDYTYNKPLSVNIRRVKSRSFASSFSKQLEVLGLGFQIDEQMLSKFLVDYKDDLGRAGDVLKSQMRKYWGKIVI